METLLQLYTALTAIGPEWVDALAKLVAGATAITMLTPTKTDNKIANTLLTVLNWMAGNVFKNKNADAQMKFVVQLFLGVFGKITNILILIRYGSMKKKLELLQKREKLRKRANETRSDVKRTPVAELRNWLRKHID